MQINERLLNTAQHAARMAGADLLRRFDGGVVPRSKGFRDWVTDSDIAAQEIAVEIIRKNHPDDLILAEENNLASPDERGVWSIPEGVTWFVDPLDGTSNYARHLPFFNVAIGAALDGQPLAGVVYDPLHDHLFAAAKGAGATLNEQPLATTRATHLSEAIIAFDSARAPDLRQRTMVAVTRLAAQCRTLRAFGSAALALAYVAAGWLDAYIHLSAQPWDVAAGVLLVQETEGIVRQIDGAKWHLGQPALVACAPQLLESVLTLLQEAAAI